MFGRELRGHQAGPPCERHARAAMAVVVDDELVVQFVGLEHEARVAMRTQADGRADDALPRRIDRRETDRLFEVKEDT